MSNDADEYLDLNWTNDMAQETCDFIMDTLKHMDAQEKFEVTLQVLTSALAGTLLAYKLINPQWSHKQLLDEMTDKVKMDFFRKAGGSDFTIDAEYVN